MNQVIFHVFGCEYHTEHKKVSEEFGLDVYNKYKYYELGIT